MAGKSAILSVRIISDAKGAIDGFKETADTADGLGGKLAAISPGALAVGGAIATGAVAVGKELYDLGARFDEVKDTIRVGTGATGEALDGLVDVAHNVATSIPASFEDAGSTVADVNTRLGLTGDTLQTVASQYLEAGRILGSEVDIAGTSAAFSAFGIQGDAVSGALDELFQVSQATGVGMNDLAAGAQSNAQAMQDLGFGFADTVRMIGAFDKAGIDSSATLGAMRKGLVGMAKPGEDIQGTFQRVTGEIKGYIDAGDSAAALNEAKNVFGAKGATQMIQAIQTGVLSMDDLTAATGQTSDTILGVGKETMDAAEKWEILKNRGLEALEPLASSVFSFVGDALGGLLDWIDQTDFSSVTGIFDTLAPIFSSFGSALSDFGGRIMPVISAIQDGLAPVVEALAPIFQTAFDAISGILGGALTVIQGIFEVIQGIFTGDWSQIWQGVQDVVSGAVDAVVALFTGFWDLLTGIFQAGVDLVTGIWGGAWDWITTAVSGAIDGVIGFVTDLPGNIVKALGNLGSLLLDAGKAVIQGLIDGITGAIGGVIDAAIDCVSGLVDGVLGFLGIHSPSRVFRDIGAQTGQGLVLGISDMAPKVADAWTDLMDVPGGPTLTARLAAPAGGQARATATAPIQITIQGALDPISVANQIEALLSRYGAITTGVVRA